MTLLVSAAELVQQLAGDEPPVVLDVRWSLSGPPGIDLYREAHIPNARFCDLDSDLAGPPGDRGRHPLPDPHAFATAMQRLGVSDDDRVVVYDGGDASVSARAWWCLRYFGHREVSVLDGGFAAWLSQSGETEAGDPQPVQVGDFTARPGGLPVLDVSDVLDTAKAGMLIDARAEARYRGEWEPIDPVAGHIPGAVNAPNASFVDGEGRFLGPADLRIRFEALADEAAVDAVEDPSESAPAAAYCGSGVNAAQVVLAGALADRRLSLYVGSWSEWVSDPSRPVALGAAAG